MSLSPARGKDWALPQTSHGATGITRPIGIALYVDRIAILPEQGIQALPRVIPMPHGPDSVLEEFVSAIWEHTSQWGVALPGGYWKPLLQVYVTPGAVPQFQQLESLLEDSGLVIERKTP
jgi:hypothetical protein